MLFRGYFVHDFDTALHQLDCCSFQCFIRCTKELILSDETFDILTTWDQTVHCHLQHYLPRKYNPTSLQKRHSSSQYPYIAIAFVFQGYNSSLEHFQWLNDGAIDLLQKLQAQKKFMLSYSSKGRPILEVLQKNPSTKENTACNTPDPKRIALKPPLLDLPKKTTCPTPTYDAVLTPRTARTTYNNPILAKTLNGSFNRSPALTPEKQGRLKKDLSFVGIKAEQERVEFKQIDNERSRKTGSRTVMFQEPTPPTTPTSQREEQDLQRLRQTVSNANSWLTRNHLPPKPVKSQVEFQPERAMRKKMESSYHPAPKLTIIIPHEETPTPAFSPSAIKFTPRNHTRTRTTVEQDMNPSKKPSQQSQTATPRISREKLTCSVNLKQTYDPMSKTDPSAFGQRTPTKRLSTTETPHKRGISLEDFQLAACKGQGRFGKVFPARHKKTGFLLAIKQVKKQSVRLMLDQFMQQLKISLFLSHPNVVKFYGFFSDSLHFYIIMEYMEQGTLYKVIKTHKKMPELEVSAKLAEICQAVNYLHSLDILHRDIKPENIVISHGVCKLCDFGWAAYSRQRRTTYCGTLDYVCPEILQGQSYDNLVDIWAIGVLAFEMLTGRAPFYHISRQETMKSIVKCDFGFPEEMSAKAKGFIAKSLQRSQGRRVSIEQLLKDQFLEDGMMGLE